MPRWKALPEELDPQVREFASQLRRLVDRSGLSLAAISDRTGYSKTSWERYLNGRLLAPKGAIVALAEVTGTNPAHLSTMWELAERAWSRAEMRHDMTMEQIRISQARAALGEFGPASASAGGSGRPRGRTTAPAPGGGPGPGSGPGSGPGPAAEHPLYAPLPNAPGTPAPSPSPTPPGGKRKVVVFLAGLVGALLVIAAAVLLTDLGGNGDDSGKPAAKSPSAAPSTSAPPLPAGVKCSGKACTGQDPEAMGCGGEFAKTVSSATVGKALVEVRYSKTCQSAWARITQAAPGDTVQISVGGKGAQKGLVNADNDAYTPMTAVAGPAEAKACATLTTGATGCTTPQ
ncbi:XRE family transcriptional regulator [Streptomyces sp. NPDC020681]|uniref:XRE family transcriptional regulator n=1 Tax=Streptomyces sp. NPDC020681 TaxID=3365083 RepID=UPI00379D187E